MSKDVGSLRNRSMWKGKCVGSEQDGGDDGRAAGERTEGGLEGAGFRQATNV